MGESMMLFMGQLPWKCVKVFAFFWRIIMTKIEFKATLQMLVPMVIQTIMEKKNMLIVDAVKLLYFSRLYEKLEIESTKLWHLSPLALYELLEAELQTGNIVFPTEA
jgi:hypothetical protein